MSYESELTTRAESLRRQQYLYRQLIAAKIENNRLNNEVFRLKIKLMENGINYA